MSILFLNDHAKITNNLDSDYYYLISLLYPQTYGEEKEEWEFLRILRAKANKKTIYDSNALLNACLLYDDPYNKELDIVKWIKSVDTNGQEITLVPNDNVYGFLKKYKVDLKALFY